MPARCRFEMSAAHERLIVNCGTYPGAPRDWRHFMRYTAAHSTAVVDDTNSTEITDHGALEYRAGNVLVDRADDEGAQWLDMSHDGYRSLYGIIHRRRLWLSPDGGDLRGEDTFVGLEGRPVTVPDRRFIVRFHLHPDGQGDPGAERPGRADAPAERPRLAPARHAAPASVSPRASISARKAACAAPSRSCWSARFPPEGITVKWALTRMEG